MKTTAVYLPTQHSVGNSPTSVKEIIDKEKQFYPLNNTNPTHSKHIYLDKVALILYFKEHWHLEP